MAGKDLKTQDDSSTKVERIDYHGARVCGKVIFCKVLYYSFLKTSSTFREGVFFIHPMLDLPRTAEW
jgi:hypothetical protein